MGIDRAIIVLFAWPVLAVMLFLVLPARKAAIASLVAGWLLLPPAAGKLSEGIPLYTKVMAVMVGAFAGITLVRFERLISVRWNWFDVPMLVWICCPMASSISNGLGVYDGASAVVSAFINWGMPYWIGRAVFGDRDALRELLRGIFIGAVLYVPLCLFENRMSAVLSHWVYGMEGGWRNYGGFGFLGWQPMVFFGESLSLTLFMGCAALAGIWLWYSHALGTGLGTRLSVFLVPVAVTALLCKSLGANVLWIMGLLVLWLASRLNLKWLLLFLLVVPPTYCVTRLTGSSTGEVVANWAGEISKDRAQSFQFRLDNETRLTEKAMQRPWFGWGGWGRSRVYNEYGKDISVTDGLWIIALGTTGLVGMCSLFAALLMPGLLVLRRVPPTYWAQPEYAAVVVLAVIMTLYAIDCLPNGMLHPLFVLGGGGVVSNLACARLPATGRRVSGSSAVSQFVPREFTPTKPQFAIRADDVHA